MISLEKKIREGLTKVLPGSTAHQKLMKQRKPVSDIKNIEKAKVSAVLVLIYPRHNIPHIVLIKRHIYNGVHSGQIGLPGGKVEKEDANLIDTALREAHEELNIDSNKIEILGKLTPLYIPPSNFIVNPFVAIQKTSPVFVPDHYEVEKVIEISLDQFLNLDNLIYTQIKSGNYNKKAWAFQIDNHFIWGATGMILKELTELIAND